MIVEESYSSFINLWIVPSAADYNRTQGVCGPWDGDVSNELTNPSGVVIIDDALKPNDYLATWRCVTYQIEIITFLN